MTSQVAALSVTADNFPRAETDLYFANIVKDGGFGKFIHRREPAAIDIRPSSVSIGTRSIRRRCSISPRGP
jgi:hypothetical protein